ncbi:MULTISPECIES: hypothetical protein [unclassified Sporosarcina]|nr:MULTISPECIES: hypothetical protein [unclassified Sporosarcina]
MQSLPTELVFHEEYKYAEKVFKSDDAKEGLKVFSEKRMPRFIGY